MKLGNLIASLRQKRGLTQSALSDGICSRKHLVDIEHNKRVPTAYLLVRLAERLEEPLGRFSRALLESPTSIQQLLTFTRAMIRRGEIDEARAFLVTIVDRIKSEERIQRRRINRYRLEYLETRALLAYVTDKNLAFRYYECALAARKRTPSQKYPLARAYCRAGMIALEIDYLEKAINYLWTAYQILQGIDPKDLPESVERIVHLHCLIVEHLSSACLRNRAYEDAWVLLSTARITWRQWGVEHLGEKPSLLRNYVKAAMGVHRYEEAQDLNSKLLAKADLPAEIKVEAYTNACKLARMNERWLQARYYAETAWDIWRETRQGCPLSIINELAGCALNDQDAAEARYWLIEGARHKGADQAVRAEYKILCAKLNVLTGNLSGARRWLSMVNKFRKLPTRIREAVWVEMARVALLENDSDRVKVLLHLLSQHTSKLTI